MPDPTPPQSDSHKHLLPKLGDKVLLIHPPVYDTRLHWQKWQQPTTLLRIGTYCLQLGIDVRLVDALYHRESERITKRHLDTIALGEISLNKWRFGLAESVLDAQLRQFSAESWQPTRVFIECLTTFWWEGVSEVVAAIRRRFPSVHIALLGGYPEMARGHALSHSGADSVLSQKIDSISNLPLSLSLYSHSPNRALISLGSALKAPADVVEEVTYLRRHHAVQHIAFAEHSITSNHLARYMEVLEQLAARDLNINLYALGNVAPEDLVRVPELASLMKRAGYVQICFSDDRDWPQAEANDSQLVEHYRLASIVCARSGFELRTEALCGGICLGRLGEDLGRRARLITLVAHHIGSVIIWPYQPSPDDCPNIPLEEQNGKLFPFHRANRHSYRDYLNVMGLATVLNSKYRSQTFDFLGDGLISKLFRSSIAREAWKADEETKGSSKLPFAIRT